MSKVKVEHLVAFLCAVMLLFHWYDKSHPIVNNYEIHINYSDSNKVINIDSSIYKLNIDTIKKKLSFRESRGRYYIINQYGYLGKYQIGKLAFTDLQTPSYNYFKKDIKRFTPSKQEDLMNKLILRNDYYLRNYRSYIGKEINGILITRNGLLQASHLVGAGAVKKYLSSNGVIISKDGNGTSLESYLIM